MTKVPSKTRRNLVIAGAAGIATLAAPKVWQSHLAKTVALPAVAQEIPPKTGEVKVQYVYRKGRWGISANGYNTIPLAVHNQFAQGTQPVVHEVQVHFRLDFPSVKNLGVELISPDGHSVMLLDRPGYEQSFESCSTKGVDITLVDTDSLRERWAPFNEDWCPEIGERDSSGNLVYRAVCTKKEILFFCKEWDTTNLSKPNDRLQGIFHTSHFPSQRRLPQFNGRLAVGDWHLRVHNHLGYNVNKVIRQIDLTVYSKW